MSTQTVEHDSEQRTSILGGEIARRGMTGISAPVLITWTAALIIGVVYYFAAGGGAMTVGLVAVFYVGVFA